MTDLAKTPFVRELASSGSSLNSYEFSFQQTDSNTTIDKKARDKATDSLSLFLRSKTDLSLLELLKLWKGLFYCTPLPSPTQTSAHPILR